MNFVTRKGYKIKYDYFHSLTQSGVLEYPQKYASILHPQKLYQAHLVNSTRYDYLVLVQFDLIDKYFYSR